MGNEPPLPPERRRTTADDLTRTPSDLLRELEESRGHVAELESLAAKQLQIHALQHQVLELTATGEPLSEVLEALVRTIEGQGTDVIGSVLLLNDEGTHLVHGAAPNLPESYNRAIDGVKIGPAVGSCGTAAYRRERVEVVDIDADPLWEDYRELALSHGLRSCWSQPIFSADGDILGTLAIYSPRPRRPTAADREYTAGAAWLAGIVIERDRAERRRLAGDRRRLRQTEALAELARSDPLSRSDFEGFIALATEVAARTLEVERVGVWLFREQRSLLQCIELYEKSPARHSRGLEIEARSYPQYFEALERGRTVAAHDARTDPDTSEFRNNYLEPLGITSMLDAPLRSEGELIGAVCHEHVGPARVWQPDEQEFGASVADFVSLVLESRQRRQAERAFRSAQTELLRQQWQATEQIETELARAKDDLVRKTRLATIGQVAASIAHDLRNPLGAIHNAAYYLKRHVPEDRPKWAEYLRIINQEVAGADAILASLLEMSRGTEPTKQDVDLGQVVSAAYAYIKDADAVQLEFEADVEPFTVHADPDQLRQILVNLLTNATCALEGRGKIRIEGRRDRDFDRIIVHDDGAGVPDDLRERIFEPLVTSKAKGTGLGLAICRQIAERHGGSIDLLDGGDGGATFCVRLPRSDSGRAGSEGSQS